ncbi:LysM domain-containing protein [Desulfitobacterium dichloroeliminans LMG P-21439]|uniref:LysM domain-containing protein n=1 Tax=Desulfitobacterium dichloroeliminans (strain LMG P-21439 / DCA1) TaxID=871963 RepID=L0F4X1_DESDL|nr:MULTISPECIES: LysM domain-containing protein [Desulfitobacteriaceae]AGA68884.1 LysM domain-containing protein [Desulfitobacterium dichloroeliminans LMG P-21439]
MYGMRGMQAMQGVHDMYGMQDRWQTQRQDYVPSTSKMSQQYKAPTRTYTVNRGDTIYNISRKYGTSMQSIIHANSLSNPNRIYPGQKLWIP